jgi:3-hydroxyisobutyrate dehydrogenase-like beta-hydroxyacid dehydrogenase
MSSTKLNVFLVGTGRLGSVVAEELLKRGDTVKILARDPAKVEDLAKKGMVVAKTNSEFAKSAQKAPR